MAITTVVRQAFRAPGPLEVLAAKTASASVGILALLALAAASIRVLPWLLDPRVPWRVAVPFGRAVASVAVEAAVLVGWPIGWALATFVLVERGEARVLAMLGERPGRTAARLAPMALLFGALLAGASLAGGRDAGEPGRVLSALLRAGRVSCGATARASALEVPLVGAAWLCSGSGDARLAGRPPFARGTDGQADALYTARAIDMTPDARRIELDDAWIATSKAGGGGPEARVEGVALHVKHAVFRLPPFVRASSLPAPWRATFLAASGAASALVAVWLLLLMEQRGLALWRLHAIAIGAAGPVACLALLHALERAAAPMPLRLYALLIVAAAAATVFVALAVWCLPGVRVAATK